MAALGKKCPAAYKSLAISRSGQVDLSFQTNAQYTVIGNQGVQKNERTEQQLQDKTTCSAGGNNNSASSNGYSNNYHGYSITAHPQF